MVAPASSIVSWGFHQIYDSGFGLLQTEVAFVATT